MQSSLQSSSLPTYQRAWNLFHRFTRLTFPGLPLQFPISIPMFCLFIAYLYDLKYAASTANTYVSALSYSHNLQVILTHLKLLLWSRCLRAMEAACSFRQQASYYNFHPAQIVAICFVITIVKIPDHPGLCFRPCAVLYFLAF